MFLRLHRLVLAFAVAAGAAASGPLPAAETAAAAAAPQSVVLRVTVDAAGKVQSAQPLDPAALPALVNAAAEISRKLPFTPARKAGNAVSSETTLVITFALVPKGGGNFGVSLRRAQNGPSLVSVGRWAQPDVGPGEGGMVVVGVDLLPDGNVDIESFKVEKVEMRTPSSFVEKRFVDAARQSLKGARFKLDKVDGVEIPARISVPFQFNGGSARRKQAGAYDAPSMDTPLPKSKAEPEHKAPPSLTAVSKIEGVELPKIDYTAPEPAN